MAIDAANDHNTDDDRAILQKEFSSRMDTIEYIAATTNYHGRLLLNGTYQQPLDGATTAIPTYTQRTVTFDAPSVTLQLVKSSHNPVGYGTTRFVVMQDNVITGLASGFSSGSDTSWDSKARFQRTHEIAQYGFQWTTVGKPIKVRMNFTLANLNGGTVPSALNQQGISIGCSGCNQYLNIKFDSGTTASSMTGTFGGDITYTIGVQNVTSVVN